MYKRSVEKTERHEFVRAVIETMLGDDYFRYLFYYKKMPETYVNTKNDKGEEVEKRVERTVSQLSGDSHELYGDMLSSNNLVLK